MKIGQPNAGARAKKISPRKDGGFALTAGLVMMVLLLTLAVGLLQVAAVSLRSTDRDAGMAAARANARVALMLAIDQLQSEMGPDRRISAPAGILDESPETPPADGVSQPHFTGVWDAAESAVAKWSLDKPSYDKKQGFRRWLVSGDPDQVTAIDLAKNGVPSSDTNSRIAVAGDSAHQVSVPVISSGRAGFAWWTSENGTKATLRPTEDPNPKSKFETLAGGRRTNADGHSELDPRLPDRDSGLDDRLLDLATLDIVASSSTTLSASSGARSANSGAPSINSRAKISEGLRHDLTTRSEIVPVDVTNGGLRKCMNTYLDWLGAQSPAVRAAAGTVGKIRNASTDYRLFSWDQLRNYESLGRAGSMVTLDPVTKRPKIRTYKQTGDKVEKEWNASMSEDRFRVQPVLLKLSYVVSYATERLAAPSNPAKPYALRLYLYPMAVLWNPYNVDLEVPEYCASGICPLTFDVNKGATNAAKVDLMKTNTATRLAFGPEMGGAEKFTNLLIPAGSTKVLYPQQVRWKDYPNEHRYAPKAPYEYYMWAQTKKFDLGDSNYGGVLKNLLGKADGFVSNPAQELAGAANDPVRISVSPLGKDGLVSLGVDGAHTDWWGNNGPGADSQDTLQKFGTSTAVRYQVDGSAPQISIIPDNEVPSRTFGQLENRPTPLLLFEFYRKAADEDLFPNKPGAASVAGNPAQGFASGSTGGDSVTPWFESAYSFRFKSISSWIDVTKTFQLPPDLDDRIYFGNSYSPRGQLSVVDQEIPLSPMVSLAELQHLPLFDYRPTYDPAMKTFTTPWYGGDYHFYLGRMTQFAQNHAIGNSYASPGIPSDKLTQAGWRTAFGYGDFSHLRVDRSYVANSVLWDSWFCSSIGSQDGLLLIQDGTKRKTRQVAEDFFNGSKPLPNDAICPAPSGPLNQLLASLFDGSGSPTANAHEKIAEYLRIEGGFNVNSVSEGAWAHFLSGLLSRPLLMMESVTGKEAVSVLAPEPGKFLISRNSLVNAPPAERSSGKERDDRYWNGAREVSADQIRELATAIVRQVKKRGPFLSLGEFVNRRLSGDKDLALCGPLQAALDDSKVSINQPFRDATLSGAETTGKGSPKYNFPAAAAGPTRQGITGYVTQADLLASLGTSVTPRSDTFTIRAMGEAKDSNGKVLARVWCEAVVQRGANYVNSADAASAAPASLQPVNARFGRRFDIVSFRWLHSQELESRS